MAELTSTNIYGDLSVSQIINGGVGTVTKPTYSFTDDTNTGMYRSALNTLSFSTDGSERIRIGATGNVGIGTTTPSSRLTVADSSTTALVGARFINLSNANNITKRSTISLNLTDTVNTVKDVVHLTAYADDGNVISGGLSISTRNSNTVTERMRITNTGALLGVNGSSAAPTYSFLSNSYTGMYSNGFDIQFATDGSEMMKIVYGEGVVIYDWLSVGISNPTTTLDVNGQIRIRGGNPAVGRVLTSDAEGYATWGNSSITIGTTAISLGGSATTVVGLTLQGPTGAVGTPTYSFTGDTNTGMYRTAAGTIGFTTNGSERLRIDSNGNVGIGTGTNTSEPLHVRKSVVNTTGTDGTFIRIDNQSNTLNYMCGILFRNHGTETTLPKGGIFFNHAGAGWGMGDFHFALNNTGNEGRVTRADTKMTLTRTGNLNVVGDIVSNAIVEGITLQANKDVNGTIMLMRKSVPHMMSISQQIGYGGINFWAVHDGTSSWVGGHASIRPSQIQHSINSLNFNYSNTLGVGTATNFITAMNINSETGRIGIGMGTGAASEALQVLGFIRSSSGYKVGTAIAISSTRAYTGTTGVFSSTVTATNFILSSDIRKKQNIEEYNVEEPLDITYKTFKFKDDDTQSQRFGVIAQDLEVKYPELVNKDDEGYLSVNYIDLMIREIAYLKNEIKKLRNGN